MGNLLKAEEFSWKSLKIRENLKKCRSPLKFDKLINKQEENMFSFFDLHFEIWNMNSDFQDAKKEYFKELMKIKRKLQNIPYQFDKFENINVERINKPKEPIKWIHETHENMLVAYRNLISKTKEAKIHLDSAWN